MHLHETTHTETRSETEGYTCSHTLLSERLTTGKVSEGGLSVATFTLSNKIVGGLVEREKMLKLFEIIVKS
jgi:hypothetical protein